MRNRFSSMGLALCLFACDDGAVSVTLDSGPQPTDTDSATTDTGPPRAIAPDYTASGPWAAGVSVFEARNRENAPLYGVAWWPTPAPGVEPAVYGWDDWNHTGEGWIDVAPDCAETRPVMVHSHGYGSISWEMFWFQEFAATHGWLVVASDHPGNTFYDESGALRDVALQRPADVADTYDWLLAENADPQSPLHGCVDPDAGYVVTGYSFGGYTSYVTAGALIDEDGVPTVDLSDDRVRAAVTFAPWNVYSTLTTGTSAIEVPVLTIGGEADTTVSTQYLDLHGSIGSVPRALGSFIRVGHYSFTPIYCFGPGNGCGDDFLAAEVFTPIVRTSVLAFLGHLEGLEGAIEQIPELSGELTWEVVTDD